MIFLECNMDQMLIKSLGFSRKQISHQRCKGEVVKQVGRSQGGIGIIDEDPGSPPPDEMKNYSKNQSKGTIKLFTNSNDKKKNLVQISPYLEHWLLERAKINKIRPEKSWGDPRKLHGLTRLEKNKKFQEFLNDLIAVDTETQTLKKWIEDALE